MSFSQDEFSKRTDDYELRQGWHRVQTVPFIETRITKEDHANFAIILIGEITRNDFAKISRNFGKHLSFSAWFRF